MCQNEFCINKFKYVLIITIRNYVHALRNCGYVYNNNCKMLSSINIVYKFTGMTNEKWTVSGYENDRRLCCGGTESTEISHYHSL